MHYILGDIKHTKCCTDLVYFAAPTSRVPLSRQNCINIISPMPSQGQGSRKLRVFGSQLLSWCIWGWYPQIPSAAAVGGEMSGGISSQLLTPTLTGRGSSILLATGRVCARSQGWCDWARYPPQVIQPQLPVWDASTPSLAPGDSAWCQAVEDLALAMKVAKNSEIQVEGKPWLLYKSPSENQLKTPAELPSSKIFTLKYLDSEVNFQTSMQYFPGSVIKANYIYISLVNYKLQRKQAEALCLP